MLMSFLPTVDDYFCDCCGHTMAETQDQGFICACGGTFKLRTNVFSIHGLEWNYLTQGYHPERDDSTGEIRHDMKAMEQNLSHNVHNLKEYRLGMKALKTFERVHKRALA